jgi:putative transposase
MRKGRYSEEKIIRVLQEVESGKAVKDVCREHGIALARTTPGRPSTAGWTSAKLAA